MSRQAVNSARRNVTGLEPAPVDAEIMQEMATALGHAGRRAEASLARLREHEGGDNSRAFALNEAADAVYHYFIQRELCGFRRHSDVIRELSIPQEVLVRLGAR